MTADLPSTIDVLVVGGGAAGLAAATWLGRYRRSTLVVDAGQQRNRSAAQAHGLLGRDPTTPAALLADARAGLEQYPQVILHEGTVSEVRPVPDGTFEAVVDGQRIEAGRVVLTTGLRDQLPEVDGLEAFYGKEVHHCPSCEGFSACGRPVVVLGGGPQVPAYTAQLLDWTDRVCIVTDTAVPAFEPAQRAALARHGIGVVDGVAAALVGAPGALEGVRLTDGRVVAADMVFFSYAHHPTNELAAELGCDIDDDGHVVVDACQRTTVDGVYAAGDLTPGYQLVAIAIGEGTTAGVACATSFHGQRTAEMAPAPAPEPSLFTVE